MVAVEAGAVVVMLLKKGGRSSMCRELKSVVRWRHARSDPSDGLWHAEVRVHVAGEQRRDLVDVVCCAEACKASLLHGLHIGFPLGVVRGSSELFCNLVELLKLLAEGMSRRCRCRRGCDRGHGLAMIAVEEV